MNKKRINARYRRVPLLVVISFLLLAGCAPKMPADTSGSESPVTVNIETVSLRDINDSTRYNGRLKAASEVQVYPKNNEQIIAIQVEEGEAVSAGQTLMTLDSSSLQVSIKRAEAQLASAQANQVNSQINLEAARKNYERTKSLYESGAASLTEMENAQNTYDSLMSGSADAAMAEAEAALLSLQEQINNCSVTTPVSGIVGRIDVSVGDKVNTAAPVAVIADSRQIKVEIMVGESEISKMVLDAPVDIYVKSVRPEPYAGIISSIASVTSTGSNMYPVTIAMDNSAGEIKSGMYAAVSVPTGGVQDALCIPLSALIPDNGVNIVYLAVEQDSQTYAARREVETGINDGEYVQILSGLNEGDKLVTLGNTLISDGALLAVVVQESDKLAPEQEEEPSLPGKEGDR